MAQDSHVDRYSIAAAFCMALVVAGVLLLAATAAVGWYFLH